MKIDTDGLYTAAEVAEHLRCGRTNVYDLMKSGEIGVTRIGVGRKGLRVRGSAIAAFLEERTAGGPKPRGTFKHLKKYID